MTSGTTPDHAPDDSGSGTHTSGPRGLQTLAYVAATVLGGIGALVVATVELLSPEAGTLDVLLWSALAVMLFAAAARRWWFGGSVEELVRRHGSGDGGSSGHSGGYGSGHSSGPESGHNSGHR